MAYSLNNLGRLEIAGLRFYSSRAEKKKGRLNILCNLKMGLVVDW